MDGFGQQTGPLAGAHLETSAAIAVADRDGRVRYWSSGAEFLLGHTPAQIIGRPVADILTADGTVLHRDGRRLDARMHLSPLVDGDRETGYLVTVRPGPVTSDSADGSFMRWLFEQSPAHLAVYDRNARVVRGNAMMLRTIGMSEDEAHGRLPAELVQDLDAAAEGMHAAAEDLERRILKVVETGEPEFTESFVRLPGESHAHAWSVDIFPLKDGAGRTCAVGWAASDLSEQYASRERLALISEARTRIGTSLDIVATARELTEVAVPRFADVVSVDLLDPVFRGELPAPILPPGPTVLRRAARRSSFPQEPDTVLGPGEAHSHPWSSPLTQWLADGRAVVHEAEALEAMRRFAGDPVPADLAEVCDAHSLIAVPVRAQNTILGVVLFIRSGDSREPFGPDDLAVTEDLVARAAICLDNARRFTRERGIALALQRSLLPQGPTVHPAVDTAPREAAARRAATGST